MEKKKFRWVFILIFIFMIITAGMWVFVPQAKTIGSIYFFMLIFSLSLYKVSQYQDSLIGIPRYNFGKSLLIGLAVGIGFYVINKVIPFFSIGFPDLPISVGEDIRFLTVVVLAPIVETLVFEGAILGGLRDNDLLNLSDFKANLIKSGLFSTFHFGAYGVVLGQLVKWSEVLGSYYANIGLFGSAFIVSFIFGYLITRKKLDSLVIPIISHAIINFTIISLSIIYITKIFIIIIT